MLKIRDKENKLIAILEDDADEPVLVEEKTEVESTVEDAKKKKPKTKKKWSY